MRQRREPVEWRSGPPFRILSLDGGGIKGIFPAAILSYLELRCLNGKTVGDYFDLIAGTSTGGILALGIGAGYTATEMLQMYLEEGETVFPIAGKGMMGRIKRFVKAKYDRQALDRLLPEKFGTKTLRDSKYRLLIPSTEGRHGESWFFKTPHHPDYTLDGDEPLSAVASATSAAPTYFTPFGRRGYTFLDGGIWANNPTMAAVVEALSSFTTRREDIRILSIGCGQEPYRITEGQEKRSGMVHWTKVIETAMYFQSVTAVSQARLLIGHDRVTRLDRAEGNQPVELDDWAKAKECLPREAEEVAQANVDHIREAFLTQPAPPYKPLAQASGE